MYTYEYYRFLFSYEYASLVMVLESLEMVNLLATAWEKPIRVKSIILQQFPLKIRAAWPYVQS